jgi:hypothetical protein
LAQLSHRIELLVEELGPLAMKANVKPQGGRSIASRRIPEAKGWMSENISGVPAGRSIYLLTSPYIGLQARMSCRFDRRRPPNRADQETWSAADLSSVN